MTQQSAPAAKANFRKVIKTTGTRGWTLTKILLTASLPAIFGGFLNYTPPGHWTRHFIWTVIFRAEDTATITVYSTNPSSIEGDDVAFIATVKAAQGRGPTPRGKVRFSVVGGVRNDGQPIPPFGEDETNPENGEAKVSYKGLAPGKYTIKAEYIGEPGKYGSAGKYRSEFNTTPQEVNKKAESGERVNSGMISVANLEPKPPLNLREQRGPSKTGSPPSPKVQAEPDPPFRNPEEGLSPEERKRSQSTKEVH